MDSLYQKRYTAVKLKAWRRRFWLWVARCVSLEIVEAWRATSDRLRVTEEGYELLRDECASLRQQVDRLEGRVASAVPYLR